MNPLSCFITGTDTEIGKTTVSCAIIRALVKKGLQVAAMKPVAAGAFEFDGALHNEDVDALAEASNMSLPLSLTTPYLLKTPIAPIFLRNWIMSSSTTITSCRVTAKSAIRQTLSSSKVWAVFAYHSPIAATAPNWPYNWDFLLYWSLV